MLVTHDARVGEFVCQVPYFPPHQGRDHFTDDVRTPVRFLVIFVVCKRLRKTCQVCRRILTAAMCDGSSGSDVPGLRIRSVRSWAMHARVAEHFISREHQRAMLVRGE